MGHSARNDSAERSALLFTATSKRGSSTACAGRLSRNTRQTGREKRRTSLRMTASGSDWSKDAANRRTSHHTRRREADGEQVAEYVCRARCIVPLRSQRQTEANGFRLGQDDGDGRGRKKNAPENLRFSGAFDVLAATLTATLVDSY
jgi:hypothetical protein